jgi:hypothetical protein
VESLEVGTGGVLSGGGVITAAEGITISSGGIHAPGFSPGVQVFDADYSNSGTLEIDLGGRIEATGALNAPSIGNFDQILVLGAVDLSNLVIDIKAYNDFSPVVGDVFRILYFSGSLVGLTDQITLLNESFSSEVQFALDFNLDGEATFLDQSGLNYAELRVTAVPEPSTYGMIVVGLAVGAVLKRRKARQAKA